MKRFGFVLLRIEAECRQGNQEGAMGMNHNRNILARIINNKHNCAQRCLVRAVQA